jgi:ribosomal protein S18 acetylase RimI-like enzyme
MAPTMAAEPLFETPDFTVRPIGPEGLPALQALWNANPAYFQAVNGRPALPDEAQQEFDEYPPPEMPFGQRWFAGVSARRPVERPTDAEGGDAPSAAGRTATTDAAPLVGLVVVVSDLMAAGVWHITLFWLATDWHGRGAGQQLWHGLEAWVRAQPGARWLRLGVVRGNTRAEAFWNRQGFVTVRERPGVDTGGRLNTLAVCVKPLRDEADAAAEIAAYLAQVPRDRPPADPPAHAG